jgi:hypothetical protein
VAATATEALLMVGRGSLCAIGHPDAGCLSGWRDGPSCEEKHLPLKVRGLAPLFHVELVLLTASRPPRPEATLAALPAQS